MSEKIERLLNVFLCHASEDKDKVKVLLYDRLFADGVDVWLDKVKLLPGQDWQIEIPKAVRTADVVVVCLTKKSVDKEGYIQKEIRIALDTADEKPEDTIYIIPAKIEECNVPARLSRWQWVNLFDPDEDGYERLPLSIRQRAEKLGAQLIASRKLGASQSDVEKPKSGYLADKTQTPTTPRSSKGTHKIWTLGNIQLVRIPAGSFVMGSAEYMEKPKHTVNIPYDFWIGRFPITNEQFYEFMKSVGYKQLAPDWVEKRNHPIANISWEQAGAFCRWLEELHYAELPKEYQTRLPTEAEWEKTARGQNGNQWPWGNVFDLTRLNCNNRITTTTPVDKYSPRGDSPYGVADMAGNVCEWTHSLFCNYPYQMNDGREDEISSEYRVLRGGSHYDSEYDTRPSRRQMAPPKNTNYQSGFRVAVAPLISTDFLLKNLYQVKEWFYYRGIIPRR